jgi:hypothetical protein
MLRTKSTIESVSPRNLPEFMATTPTADPGRADLKAATRAPKVVFDAYRRASKAIPD